jgi:Flp pilus assembly protein TadG
LGRIPGPGANVLRRLRRALKREEGQALVELALALPILLLVLLAIVDFGRAVNYWNSETSLANTAARYVSVGTLPTSGPCTQTTISGYMACALTNSYGVNPVTSGNGISGMSYCVSVPNNQAGQPVTVRITGSYQWLPLLKLATVKVTGSATMPLENTVSSSLYTQATTCTN